MRIKTKFFGEIEIDEKSIYTFKDGIPAFNHLHRFVLIDEKESPFFYLQALEEEYSCFIMLPSFSIIPDYEIDLSENTVRILEIGKSEDVMLYSILTVPEDIKKMTANMQAPIVLNIANRTGMQEVLDDDKYSRKHKLVKESDV